MTANTIITIVVGVLTIAALLYEGYKSRKQARQIELYRVDPKAGLVPPPHPLWKFIVENRYLLLALVPTVGLIMDVMSSKPLTRVAVFSIALDVGVAVFMMAMYFVDHHTTVLMQMADIQWKHIQMTERIFKGSEGDSKSELPPPSNI
jgi:hypothetical protein